MSDEEPNIFSRAISSFADFFIGWWREATGPMKWDYSQTPFRAVIRRIMLWLPVAVVVVVAAAAFGLQYFIAWRAHDLARKAVVSVEEGKIPAARMLITSARNLRPDDPEVLRAMAVVETRMGLVGAAQTWQRLPAGLALTPEELELRATAMIRGGNDGQFKDAVASMEAAGLKAQAALVRAQREAARGNLQQAIVEARSAVAISGASGHRLSLLRLLVSRHGSFLNDRSRAPSAEDLAGAREMADIVDSLQGAPEGEEAIALVLRFPELFSDQVRGWCAAAWKRPSPDNPALLAASSAMIASGEAKRGEMINRLKAVYAGSDPARKAALASWLVTQGDAEGALAYAPAAEAVRSSQAFAARSAALGSLGKWDELLALSGGAGTVPRSLMLAAAAQANAKLDRAAQAQRCAQDAVRAAADEGTVAMTLRILDEAGFRKTADAAIIALCGESETGGRMFAVARDRFGRGGQPASLQAAFERAAAASPKAPAVADRQRRSQLLSGMEVDPRQTAAALAEQPTDLDLRMTHALALLKDGQPKEAMALFNSVDVFVQQLAPGQQAVVAAIFAANGEDAKARGVAKSIDPGLLDDGEYALIAPLRLGGDALRIPGSGAMP